MPAGLDPLRAPMDGVVCCIYCLDPAAEAPADQLAARLSRLPVPSRVVRGPDAPMAEMKARCLDRGVRFVVWMDATSVRKQVAAVSALVPTSSNRLVDDAELPLQDVELMIHTEEYLFQLRHPEYAAPPGAGGYVPYGGRHPREQAAARVGRY